ncbi:PaaX family transcriptional regulator C-terminal domain-containing protein [Microbaculum sp. FT89]|uniref:PaaX family transcriptional regulator C-terminal domain-containing protein n=1 Tax=Microbaculum sp. FT89 TaxID=3447298 RepID=UPI003F52AB16
MIQGSDSATRSLDALIERFHSGERLRVWSFVITVFGDAIVPRGGMVGMAALQELTDRMRIAPGALRAALSRLAKDGWVERHRHGRKSYYRLTPESAATFARAARRIYAAGPPAWNGRWTIAIAPEETASERDARTANLTERGFVRLSNGLFIHPRTGTGETTPDDPGDLFVLDADAATVPDWVLSACSDVETDIAYSVLGATIAPLEDTLAEGGTLSPLDAMVARALLIHEWRRVLLRDADLPAALRPADWSGEETRTLVAGLYGRILAPSERWLDGCDGRPDGPLPPPERDLRGRFT